MTRCKVYRNRCGWAVLLPETVGLFRLHPVQYFDDWNEAIAFAIWRSIRWRRRMCAGKR